MSEEINHTAVIILTKHYKISGCIDLVPGARLTDYIAAIRTFFAVTDVVVEDISTGKVVFQGEFVDVNRDNVEVIMPANAILK
ncbi:MAG: hypothetical protein KKG47_06940 [Proteobacteria bacterium]|nr:hypothetical protein [Pseudomonadota bacterium]MBU1739141.1 hypothetical protein [Pseudomonadota bacterium]